MRKEAPFFLLLVGLICSFSACTSGISTDYNEGLGFVSGKEAEIAPQSALILYQK